MDLADQARLAHRARSEQTAVDRAMQTAQNRRRQHKAIEELADRFGLSPVPIGELFAYDGWEPGPSTYWSWVYPITKQVSLIIRTTGLDFKPEAWITDANPRNRNQLHRAQRVQSLADIGAYLAQIERP